MLRRLFGICFLIAIFGVFSATSAKADDVFTYEFGSDSFTWDLAASPSIVPPNSDVPGSYFEIVDVPFSENNGPQTQGTFDFYEAPDHGGGFQLISNSSLILNLFGPQLYTGGEGSPTFKLGTFDLNNDGVGPMGTLTIKNTPEPSSLLLLGAGLLALLGFTRKKIIAVA